MVDPSILIRYAAKTEAANDGSNTTYFSVVEDEVLFIVADAPDPDESKELVVLLGDLVKGKDRRAFEAEDRIKGAVHDVKGRFAGVSFATVAIRGKRALIASEGKAPVFVRRGDRFDRYDSPCCEWVDVVAGDTIMVIDQHSADAIGVERLRMATPDRETGAQTLTGLVALLTEIPNIHAKHASSVQLIHIASARSEK